MSQRPNIVEFIWHDLGDWLGCYGHPAVPSPNLDRLAQQGAVFQNHFCTAPQCSPARASIKSGLYPQAHGVMGLVHRGWAYRPRVRPFPLLLADAGYDTALCGLQHEQHGGQMPYKHVLTTDTRSDLCTPHAVDYLRQGPSEPFFLSVGFSEVHRNYGPDYDPGLVDRLQPPGYLPDEPMVRKDFATLLANIQRADAAVGRVLDELEAQGLADNTMVFFTTDHGLEMPRAKMTLYDAGLKCALLMRWPGQIQPGTRVEGLSSHVDIMPTVLEAAGVDAPAGLHGSSLWPLLRGGAAGVREHVFAQMSWHGGEYDPTRAVRDQRYKYIRNFVPGWPVQIGGSCVERYGCDWINEHLALPRPAEELYDLASDPWEMTNLADDRAMDPVRSRLAGELDRWMQSLDDPILKGPIAPADPEKVGQSSYWGCYPSRDPVRSDRRFGVVLEKPYGEQPL